MKLIKFTVASFRESDHTQKSMPVYLTTSGPKMGKEQSYRAWNYEITTTTGETYQVYGSKKRWKIKDGDAIKAWLQNGSSVSWRLTDSEFISACSKRIDRMKLNIKEAEEEIARLRAL